MNATIEYRRQAATGLNKAKIRDAIIEDCKTYHGEERMLFIGSDAAMARQFLNSVTKNNARTTYCEIVGDYCKIPPHITGYDKFNRPIKALPMFYIGDVILLLQSNSKITVTLYDSDGEALNKVIYARRGGAWNIVFTYDYTTAKVVNGIYTLKEDCRKRIAKVLGIPADPEYHEVFNAIVDDLRKY